MGNMMSKDLVSFGMTFRFTQELAVNTSWNQWPFWVDWEHKGYEFDWDGDKFDQSKLITHGW